MEHLQMSNRRAALSGDQTSGCFISCSRTTHTFQNINLVISIFNRNTMTFNQTLASICTRVTNVLLGPGTLEDVLVAVVVNDLGQCFANASERRAFFSIPLLVDLVQASCFCVSAREGGLKIHRFLFIPLSGHWQQMNASKHSCL